LGAVTAVPMHSDTYRCIVVELIRVAINQLLVYCYSCASLTRTSENSKDKGCHATYRKVGRVLMPYPFHRIEIAP